MAQQDTHDLGYVENGGWVDAIDARQLAGEGQTSKLVSYMWRMTECHACNRHSVWRNDELIFPRSAPVAMPHKDMPGAARELYEEARGVFSISKRASAALARAALESLLREQDPMTGTPRLDDRIAHLFGRVSPALWHMLTAIRTLGNEALHVDEPEGAVALYLGDDSGTVADLLFRAINDLVDELITKPREAKAFYDQLPKGVREAAEKKAAKELAERADSSHE